MARSRSKKQSSKRKSKSQRKTVRRSSRRSSFNPLASHLASPLGLGLGYGLQSPFFNTNGNSDIQSKENIAQYLKYAAYPQICTDRTPNEQDCNSNPNCQFNYKQNSCQVSQLKLDGLEKFSDDDTLQYLQSQPYAS